MGPDLSLDEFQPCSWLRHQRLLRPLPIARRRRLFKLHQPFGHFNGVGNLGGDRPQDLDVLISKIIALRILDDNSADAILPARNGDRQKRLVNLLPDFREVTISWRLTGMADTYRLKFLNGLPREPFPQFQPDLPHSLRF